MYYGIFGRSDGEHLILLHGFTGTGEETFEPFFDKLGKCYRLIVPDLRGHGRTTNPHKEIHHADFARDTAAFAIALGLNRAHFCGHSSGGMQLLFLALEHPKLVHSLALVSTTYTFDDHVKTLSREFRASASPEWIDSLKVLHGETYGIDYAETILDLWLKAILRPNELPYTPDDLNEITCPTLVLHGDRDIFFPIHVPATMYQSISNSELCILPNCGHGLIIDSPSMFVRVLLEWLARNKMK
jgi:pimeloyl-ACP methyl ester carboxylesterase